MASLAPSPLLARSLRCLPSSIARPRLAAGLPSPFPSRPASSTSPFAARRPFSSSFKQQQQTQGWGGRSTTLALVGLSALGWSQVKSSTSRTIHCDASPVPPPPASSPVQEPKSIVNPYELGFGAVCGICAGVFVKKGAKMLAFLLGGVFVLLQYLNSLNLVKVNWSKIGSRYTNATTSKTDGAVLTAQRAFNWVVDFLTRDFQQRATFVGGFVLGIRLG